MDSKRRKELLRRRTKKMRMLKKLVEKNRHCDECQACCEVLGIKEIEKPPQERCQHQCSTGCGIYQIRPQSCRDYKCMWLQGAILDDDFRPDKCGVIFEVVPTSMFPHCILAREYKTGALEDPKNEHAILALFNKDFVIIKIWLDGRRKALVHSPEQAEDIKEFIRTHASGEELCNGQLKTERE
jgi:hypothetical protein